MTALAADRKTDMKDGEQLVVPVAANAVIYAGAIVVLNGGYADKGQTATGLVYLGKSEQFVDNTGGANGDKTVKVRRKKAFKWLGDGSITQADVGAASYIVDDQTLADTDGTGTRSAGGTILQVDTDGVWIE